MLARRVVTLAHGLARQARQLRSEGAHDLQAGSGIARQGVLLSVFRMGECQADPGPGNAGQARETSPPRRFRNPARAPRKTAVSCLLRGRPCLRDFLFEHPAGVEQVGIECRLVIHPVKQQAGKMERARAAGMHIVRQVRQRPGEEGHLIGEGRLGQTYGGHGVGIHE